MRTTILQQSCGMHASAQQRACFGHDAATYASVQAALQGPATAAAHQLCQDKVLAHPEGVCKNPCGQSLLASSCMCTSPSGMTCSVVMSLLVHVMTYMM